MPESDVDLIRLALETARERGFAEVDLESDGVKFSAKLEAKPVSQPVARVHSEDPPPVEIEAGPEVVDVISPCVGYFQQGSPGLQEGRSVAPGEIVASIQALGIANDVETAGLGEIVEVLVSDGDPVEFAQVLARVKVEA